MQAIITTRIRTLREDILFSDICLSFCLFTGEEVPCQWRIQDFPQGGRQLPKVLLFFNFLPKTAWKWKNLDPQGGRASLAPPLGSANACDGSPGHHMDLFKLVHLGTHPPHTHTTLGSSLHPIPHGDIYLLARGRSVIQRFFL